MANTSTSQDSQCFRLTMNEILQCFGMSILSKKNEDKKVGFNVVMSASDEDLIQLGVRTIGDRVRRRVNTRSFISISVRDTHITSSNRPGREERALLFSPSMSSTRTDEGRTVGQTVQSRAFVSNINRKRKLIIHRLGNLYVCQIAMTKKCQHQWKNKCYRRQVWRLKNKI